MIIRDVVVHSSNQPFPWRITSASPSVQLITVDGSVPPIPPSMMMSASLPNFSSMSSGLVMYSMSSPSSNGRVVVRIGASSNWQISRITAWSGMRIPTSLRFLKIFGKRLSAFVIIRKPEILIEGLNTLSTVIGNQCCTD